MSVQYDGAAEVADWQLARADSHTSTGLRTAESKVFDHLPDADVKEALQAIREGFRVVVYLFDVEGARSCARCWRATPVSAAS